MKKNYYFLQNELEFYRHFGIQVFLLILLINQIIMCEISFVIILISFIFFQI